MHIRNTREGSVRIVHTHILDLEILRGGKVEHERIISREPKTGSKGRFVLGIIPPPLATRLDDDLRLMLHKNPIVDLSILIGFCCKLLKLSWAELFGDVVIDPASLLDAAE